MSSQVLVVPTDFANAEHQQAFLKLMDHYAQDPMGGGNGLSDYALAHLIPALASRVDCVSLLAFADGQAVGLLNAFEGFSTFAAKPLLNIHDIVVHKSCRGSGVGQALLGACENLARQRGCCKLTLEVLSNNQRALASYEGFGFAPYVLDPAAGQALFLEKKF